MPSSATRSPSRARTTRPSLLALRVVNRVGDTRRHAAPGAGARSPRRPRRPMAQPSSRPPVRDRSRGAPSEPIPVDALHPALVAEVGQGAPEPPKGSGVAVAMRARRPSGEAPSNRCGELPAKQEGYRSLDAVVRAAPLDGAYRIQEALHQLIAADGRGEIAGWTIALTSKAMQQMTGVDHPAPALPRQELEPRPATSENGCHVVYTSSSRRGPCPTRRRRRASWPTGRRGTAASRAVGRYRPRAPSAPRECRSRRAGRCGRRPRGRRVSPSPGGGR